ncbi:ABC transporter substrate-binding protein [Flavisphingomonas formosensis]|uniref:ABC transporter substrate-binding protein n=1 Tax=Flavisphingomonas formosensis TaxID=861534 RepID=UPI0018DFEE3E|nr:ABC transporter substrate-binding protein [Sphingomonas formosensis]
MVSLNLCTDDMVLLLADPGQIASLSYLSHDPRESALWRIARRHASNDGSMLSVAALKPDLIVSTGGGPRDRATLARAIGARIVDLPYPLSLDDLEAGIRQLAAALGQPARGIRLIAQIAAVRRSTPRQSREAIFLSGGGRSLSATGLGAQWLRLAGIRQQALPGDRIGVEALLRHPPQLLVRSTYRAGETSREGAWLSHPALRTMPRTRTITTDGRRWTCMGPSLLPEILRLRTLNR